MQNLSLCKVMLFSQLDSSAEVLEAKKIILCANTQELHKSWNFFVEINIFEDTKKTHQEMQNSLFCK